MATGLADIAACAKVSDFRTLLLPLSSRSSLYVSLLLSRACQYTSTCLMGPSEELTADVLVSLFPPAILLDLASVITHATDKQLRTQHLCSPPSTPPHTSMSLQKRSSSVGAENKLRLTPFLKYRKRSRISLHPLGGIWIHTQKHKYKLFVLWSTFRFWLFFCSIFCVTN